MKSSCSFGSDPEFMLKDTKGGVKSAVEIILGDRDNRISVNGNEFYHDNVMAEVAIKPGTSKAEVLDNFRQCFQDLASMVSPLIVVPQASATYPDAELQTEDARHAGCSEEYCCYGMCALPKRTEEMETNNFRSAGGHIHVGVDDGALLQEPHWGVRMMDLFVGIPALFLDTDPTSPARKALYGNAGSHRPKDYGFEYRALGNFWLSSPKLVGLMYDLSTFVANFCTEQRHLEFWHLDEKVYNETYSLSDSLVCHGYDVAMLRATLDKGTRTAEARNFLDFIGGFLPKGLQAEIISLMAQGKPYDMYKEWGINA